MPDSPPRPTVGVQAIVTRRGWHRSVLLGRRRGIFGDGQWALPGGHLEFGESFEDATSRELAEETGLKAQMLYVWKSVNTPYTNTHYVQIGVQVTRYVGDLRNLEPERCAELRWCSLDALPSPLFGPSKPFLELLRKRDSLPSATDAEPSLSIFLNCLNQERNQDKYISYYVIGRPPTVFVKLGRRKERKDREVRSYQVETVDDAVDILRQDILRRMRDGYRLFDARGSYGLELVRALFPDGSVAFRSLRREELENRDAEAEIRAELRRRHAQMSLFSIPMPDGGDSDQDLVRSW